MICFITMADDYNGIIVLLKELRRKSSATSEFYRDQAPANFKAEDDWPRNAEIDLVEALVLQKAKEVTGQSEISESVWQRWGAFTQGVAGPWLGKARQPGQSTTDSQLNYKYGESKFHEATALWADHTLDFLRYLKTIDTNPPKTPSPATILFLAANPLDKTRLRLDAELREIRDELERAQLRDRFLLHSRGAVRIKDLVRAMLDLNPTFVHFSGHGDRSGSISVEDEQGNTVDLEPDALARLFQASGSKAECVVLNACFSLSQARAIAAHVPYVIGMTAEIGDSAAINFATGFYRAIGAGRLVPEAFKFGLLELKLYGIPEEATPLLLTPTHDLFSADNKTASSEGSA